MKIRSDFVTNSSSSSFIGYGITISSSELIKILKFDKIYEDFFNNKNVSDVSEEERKKVILDLLEDNELFYDLNIKHIRDYNFIGVGISHYLKNFEENEGMTIGDIKNKVITFLSNYLDVENKKITFQNIVVYD